MKSPLRIGARRAPKYRLNFNAGRILSGKARRFAGLSAVGAVAIGVATGSALFVDYLADRALARSPDGPVAVKPAVAESVDIVPEALVASTASAVQPAPAAVPVPLQPEPIEVKLPDAADIARVAVGAENAVETSSDDPEAEPILAYADEGSGDADFVQEDETTTGAISREEATPARKQKKKAAKVQPAAKETEVASLPGVNVGGLAGHPSDDGDASESTARTVLKPAKAASASGGAVSGTALVKSPVNMRSGPKKGAGVLGVVPRGSSVQVVSCESWCQISWNGRTGWVYKSFLSAAKK